jgi:hypothetical protein
MVVCTLIWVPMCGTVTGLPTLTFLRVLLFLSNFLSVVPPPQKNSNFRPTTYNNVTRPTIQPPYRTSTLIIGAAARNPNFRGSRCTLTGRGSQTHPNWSGQKLQAASLCELPPKRGWYVIFMASAGGGGEAEEWRDDCKRDFGPWFKSQKSLISFFWRTTDKKSLTNNRKRYYSGNHFFLPAGKSDFSTV